MHQPLALLSAFFGIVSMTLFAATQMIYYSAPIFFKGSAYLSAFPPEQLDAMSVLLLSIYGRLGGLFMLFYGAGWMVRGYLTYRSGYFPKLLGVLMAVGGTGFVLNNVTKLLAPSLQSPILLFPMFATVLATAGWMLFKGANVDEWNRAAGAPPD